MVNDQFLAVMELLSQIEANVALETKATHLSGSKNGLLDTNKLRHRRRSEGNLTVSWLAAAAKTFTDDSMAEK